MENNKKRILLIDDDPDFLNLMKMRLEHNGYEILLASRGEEGLEILDREGSDIVLLDILMPDMDGLEVNRRIKRMKHMAATPIIFFTGKNSVADKVQGLKEGVSDYITKPVDNEELLARIESALHISEHYKEISFTDELTGLYNHNYFNEQFTHSFEIAKRYGRPFSLMILDIDDFKGINDRCGHICGDTVLEAVGSALKKCLRNVDTITRYGGDEFAVIFPETDVLQIPVAIKRLEAVFGEFKVEYKSQAISVSVSIGTSTYDGTINSKEALFDIADRRMYENKKGYDMENRRRFPRFERQFAIAYYPQGNATKFSYTVSKNVSRGGICINAISSIVKNGGIIKMEIEINEKQFVPVTGKVRWVKTLNHQASLDEELPIELTNDEEAGIEFIDVDPADIDKLMNVPGSLRKPNFFDLQDRAE